MSRLTCPDPLNRPEGMTPEEFTNHLVAELEDRIKTLGSGVQDIVLGLFMLLECSSRAEK